MSLATVSTRFFKDNPPSVEFYAQWKSSYPWNERLMPVYHWDGVLYVAVSDEIPKNWPQNIKAVFLKAETSCLAQTWSEYNKTQTAPPPVAKTEDLLELADESLEETKVSEEEAVEELDLTSEEDKKTSLAKTPVVNLSALSNSTSPAAAATATPALAQAPAQTPVAPPASKATPKPSSNSSPSDVFTKMKTHYQKSLILRREGNAVKPWKWDDSIKFDPNSDNIITLGIPSPFRIVAKTLKSYHGYVVPNDVSDKFFEECNQGSMPDHITLSPIVIDEQLVGMLLAIGEKSINQKSSLILAEKCASELAEEFKKIQSPAAA